MALTRALEERAFGRYERARQALDEALRLDPANVAALRESGDRVGAEAAVAAPTAPPGRYASRRVGSGIDFVLDHGGGGRKHVPEINLGGVALFDHDGDTDLDLYVATHLVYDPATAKPCGEPEKGEDHLLYCKPEEFPAARDRVFRNDGGRDSAIRFSEITDACGIHAGAGRGLAVVPSDYDDDGDIDLVVVHRSEPPELLENLAIRPGVTGPAWIGVDLRGKGGNSRAIGARVECLAAGRRQVEEVRGTGSYAAWNDTRIVFGLGDHRGPVTLRVRWPDGRTSDHADVATGRYLLLSAP
ncbi:MAG: hypothetical protein FJ293_10265 [Planctomycetes bacterium]|nr:hypothetical protein [Planctomycetota bacterium]